MTVEGGVLMVDLMFFVLLLNTELLNVLKLTHFLSELYSAYLLHTAFQRRC